VHIDQRFSTNGPPTTTVVRDYHSAWWSASKGYRPLGPTFLFFNAINTAQFWQFSMAQFSVVIHNREKIFLIKWSSSLKDWKPLIWIMWQAVSGHYPGHFPRTFPRTLISYTVHRLWYLSRIQLPFKHHTTFINSDYHLNKEPISRPISSNVRVMGLPGVIITQCPPRLRYLDRNFSSI